MNDYARCLLLIVMWREARGDGREAMRAVGHVIANRVKFGWAVFINTVWTAYIDIITKPNQFSSMTVVGDSQTILWPSGTDVQNLLSLVGDIIAGRDPDNTNGALYYANEEHVTSGWYKENIIDNPEHPVLAVIGKQTFRK